MSCASQGPPTKCEIVSCDTTSWAGGGQASARHTHVGCGTGGEVNPVGCAGAVEQRLRDGGEVGGSGGGGRRASEVNCHDCIFAD